MPWVQEDIVYKQKNDLRYGTVAALQSMQLHAQLRPLPDHGSRVAWSDLLCCWLLPAALFFTTTDSTVYITCSKTAVALATAAMLVYWLDFIKVRSEVTKNRMTFPMLIVTIAGFTMMARNEGFSMCIAGVLTVSFRPLLLKLLRTFPQSFTFGEGVLVIQGALLILTATCISHYNDPAYLLHQGLNFSHHCLATMKTSILLLTWWAALSLGAISVVAVYNANAWPVGTKTRKIFHLAVILVYIPGLALDPLLLYAASLGATGLMLVLESLRWSSVSPSIADILNNALAGFTDSKDSGSLILTHIYLLIGVSLPLWVWPHPLTAPSPLPLYAGVLSVGVADSAASIVGSRWGTIKWFGSDKTVEGSVGAVFATLGVALVLEKMHFLAVSSRIKVALSVVATVIVEASTDQVDNFTLPLVMYSLLVI